MTTPLPRKLHVNAFTTTALFLLFTSQVFCQPWHQTPSLLIISKSCSSIRFDSKSSDAFIPPPADLKDTDGIKISQAAATLAELVKFNPKLNIAYSLPCGAQLKPNLLAFAHHVLVKLTTLPAPARGIIGLFY
jgi:hypothetical protein